MVLEARKQLSMSPYAFSSYELWIVPLVGKGSLGKSLVPPAMFTHEIADVYAGTHLYAAMTHDAIKGPLVAKASRS